LTSRETPLTPAGSRPLDASDDAPLAHAMTAREKLSDEAIAAFLAKAPGWERRDGALARTFTFKDYGGGVAFAVRVALAAERRDHRPASGIFWGRVTVAWSTHDAGGLTSLDVEMAKRSDEIYAG